ncbi:hypothetical protein OY671_009338, partial [Metschnikowia pulcherrima]
RAGARGHDLVKRCQDSAGGGNGGSHGHGLAQHGRFGNADRRRFSIIRMRREKGAGVCRFSKRKAAPFEGGRRLASVDLRDLFLDPQLSPLEVSQEGIVRHRMGHFSLDSAFQTGVFRP